MNITHADGVRDLAKKIFVLLWLLVSSVRVSSLYASLPGGGELDRDARTAMLWVHHTQGARVSYRLVDIEIAIRLATVRRHQA